ncbi:superoxide dismutase [Helicobacter sp. 13S00401-1]|uniref:superoxide dismutase n=1 Tax=Helicobacter sp. 13S00401-1 TaxID=1905758 RepID=UPI000BA7620E|nr:superoxide dismutase [Helicobacter sp. 13S00401-1]PAF50108.1 superoxide dismutase [Helicobacter sp. 13S00401-1]
MFKLRNLPNPVDAFKDFYSEEAFAYHHGKHHQAYVTNLNNLIKGTEFENAKLYDIIEKSSGGLFNNAAQIYNHDFFWDCFAPLEGSKNKGGCFGCMSSELKKAIESKFGSIEKFKEEFIKAASTLFGSGWTWLVYNLESKSLEIVQTSNAQTPIKEHKVPLLVVDVWEHSYYIDYKNLRPTYLEKFFNHINWAFVSQAYEWALKNGKGTVAFYIDSIHPEEK